MSNVLGGLLVVALGLLNLMDPMTMWKISEGWKYKHAEPSDGYLLFLRIGGFVCILFGISIMFMY
ncbi:MAG: hypothetical protein IKU95_02965 [Clostridia bacterium]|nr:hypothetical protein [Clostridia bacterium]